VAISPSLVRASVCRICPVGGGGGYGDADVVPYKILNAGPSTPLSSFFLMLLWGGRGDSLKNTVLD
jgi:hypothetical protein